MAFECPADSQNAFAHSAVDSLSAYHPLRLERFRASALDQEAAASARAVEL